MGETFEPAIDTPPPVDDAAMWRDRPESAFERWTVGRWKKTRGGFDPHSVEQYKAMFHVAVTWFAEKGIALVDAKAPDIDRFLGARQARPRKPREPSSIASSSTATTRARAPAASVRPGPASPTTRRRYLNLLTNVFERLRELKVVEGNPAEILFQQAEHADYDRPAPTILEIRLTNEYIAWANSREIRHWTDLRDRAMRLLFLASGITVGELRALSPDDLVRVDDPSGAVRLELQIKAHGKLDHRVVPVGSFAVRAVLDWADRLGTDVPDAKFLFAARARGAQPGDLPRATESISPTDAFIAVQDAMVAIGYLRPRQGPQTLRNSFIARQIYAGQEPSRITRWLGLSTNETVNKIARLVSVPRGTAPPV